MLTEKIRRQATALLEMTLRPDEYPEEAERANSHLLRLQDEHCFTIDDIDPEAIQERVFAYSNKGEKDILLGIFSMVTSRCQYRKSRTGRKVSLKTTLKQKIEIERLFRAYRAKFKTEVGTLLDAFMVKHELWNKNKDGYNIFYMIVHMLPIQKTC